MSRKQEVISGVNKFSVNRAGLLDVGGELIETNCQWNEHGNNCQKRGINADSTNGAGPWYCREHYKKLHGW